MQRQVIYHSIIISTAIFLAFFPGLVFAQTAGTDAMQMLINLSKAYPALWRMTTAVCYIIGFMFVVRAVYYLKQYGELRTMMASQTSLKTPIVFFIVGSVFIYIPSGLRVMHQTVFGYSSPLAYSDVTSGMNPVALNAIVGLITFIGLISFIRGWMILAAHAQQPGGQATLGKAITHIVGGLCAMNVLGIVDIIWNTFGLKGGINISNIT